MKRIGGDPFYVLLDDIKYVYSGNSSRIYNVSLCIYINEFVKHATQTRDNLIEKYIVPGSIIYSDCWKAYEKIDKKTYQHSVVNHSQNFVDPNTGVHIQNIERLWRDIREGIPRYGRKEYHFNHYLAEFMFKKAYDFYERLDAYFEIMSIMYPLTENINE